MAFFGLKWTVQYIFAVLTLAELGITVKPLLEAHTIVLLTLISLAIAAFAH